MKRILASICCFLGMSCSSQAMTPAEFTTAFVKALRAEVPSLDVTIKNDLELNLKHHDGSDFQSNLHNAYQTYLLDPSNLNEVIKQYVASTKEIFEHKVDADTINIENLVPIVKDKLWLSEAKSQLIKSFPNKVYNEKTDGFVYEDYNDDLAIVYAVDNPANFSFLTQKGLEKSNIPREKLHDIAINNLNKKLPNIELHSGPLVSMITAGGNFEASILLLDNVWTGQDLPYQGNIVIAIPARDVLLLADAKNPEAISKLREMVKKSMDNSSYTLTDQLFIYKNGKFERLTLFNQ
jgi:uncharacterized protein YtpQ (UPF0354 family)